MNIDISYNGLAANLMIEIPFAFIAPYVLRTTIMPHVNDEEAEELASWAIRMARGKLKVKRKVVRKVVVK